MKEQLLELLHEQTSPLFRVMAVSNPEQAALRKFENNIVAFHVGDGNILSVSHNLRSQSALIRSVGEDHFQKEVLTQCSGVERELLEAHYKLDPKTNIRHAKIASAKSFQALQIIFTKIKYDNRWVSQYEKGQAKPHLIIQFPEKLFYKDEKLTKLFQQNQFFYERSIGSYTFLIELELTKAWYAEDIALYKMVNVPKAILEAIPAAQISFELHFPPEKLYCVQASPNSHLGRMFNESRIEGMLEQHVIAPDKIGGNYLRTGLRYFLKGYFRFGSSGAPYFTFNEKSKTYEVNAVQSEASPIQLSIKNDRNGNYQYVNAIASPLAIIEDELKALL